LRILTSIRPGVHVHIHDIFTPFNYPELWVESFYNFWNEQYVLEALLSGGDDFEVFASLHYLGRRYPDQSRLAMPLLKLRDKYPQSFWITKAK